MNFVPAEFFRQFLADLGKPTVYSVKDTSHWRAPIFHTSTRRISFKIFEMKAIRSALPEIQIAQAWCGNRTISEDDENELEDIKTAEDAIHAAVKRARTTRRRVSCRNQLNVIVPYFKTIFESLVVIYAAACQRISMTSYEQRLALKI